MADKNQPKTPVQAAPEPAPAPVEPVQEARHDDTLREPIVVDPKLNPRNRAMDEIAERRKAELAEETGLPVNGAKPDDDAPADPEYTAPEGEQAAAPQEPLTETPPSVETAPAVAAPVQDPGINPEAEYTFVVDGRQVKIKGSQVIARVQKNESADQRLQAATQILHEVQSRAQMVPPQQGAQPAPAQPASGKSDAELAHEIQFGTQEQAAAAIAEIRRRDASSVTPEGLQQFVATQIPNVVADQLDVVETAKFVRGEYGDLLADPYLDQLFKAEFLRARQAGDTRSRMELSRHVGDTLRQHFNRPKPNQAQAPIQTAPTLEQRREVKRTAPAAPRLASARLDGGGQPALTPEQARAAAIEKMRNRSGVNAGKNL